MSERKIYNKLVRDNIPEIIKKAGGVPEVRLLHDAEYIQSLRLKLLEEAKEVRRANSREELMKELADVFEVIEAIARAEGIASNELHACKAKRADERGGFDKRIFFIAS